MSDIAYIADTKQLARLVRDGTSHSYNRSIMDGDVEEFIDRIDPDGVHIISVFPLHHPGLSEDDPRQGLHYHINGREVEPHYRCQVWIKQTGIDASADQAPLILDFTIALVEMLPTNKPKDEAHRRDSEA